MKSHIATLLLGVATIIIFGCNADDGSTTGETNGGNPGGMTPIIQLGLVRSYYHFDNTSTPQHQVFPVDNPDPVSVAFQYDDMSGYNAVEFRLENGDNSSLRIQDPAGPEVSSFIADVVGLRRGDVRAVDLIQNQHPFRQSEGLVVSALNVVSQRSDGTFEISGQKEIGRLSLDFYANKLIDIEIINARTFNGTKKTNDAPKTYSGPRINELLDFFITTAALTMASVTSSNRDLAFDLNEDGALDAEPILRYQTPEFASILQYEVPGKITIINIKDIHTYFSLASSVNLDDKELVITSLNGLKFPNNSRVFIDDEDNFKDEWVICTLKPGSSQTYNIAGNGPSGGFKFPHTSVTTKAKSQYLVQGVASPAARVAIVQEGDFAYADEETRDIYFGVTAAHEIFHSQDFQLTHDGNSANIMYADYPPGGNLKKAQWDKIHGL